MNKLINYIIKNKLILTILLIGAILRFVNLGYSDFQGDEIKALFLPDNNQTTMEFLLDQRKGPVQFIITYLLKFIDPLYQNQFLMRFPFALAGLVSIYYFYKLVEELFDEKIAFFASFFFATNGFLIAFSRIVQYQSFVIMFMLATLYYLKKKKIYLGLICWALSILSHYDGGFIFPLAFYFIYQYLVEDKKLNLNKLKHFIFAGIIATSLLAVFYIPFVFNILNDQKTQDYWLGRITGDVSSKLSSSKYLFTVYQPIYVIHIYLGLILVSLGTLGFYVLKKFKKLPKLIDLENKFNDIELVILGLWLIIPLLFMEILVYIPGTHIYTYLIPAFIFVGLGVSFIHKYLLKIFNKDVSKWIFSFGVLVIFLFISTQVYAVFVDNKQEYPWEEEKFLVWTFPKPTPIFHLSMFGFPYYRGWEDIGDFIRTYPNQQQAYSTNERSSISRHHISLSKDTSDAGFFVYIKDPQSFTNKIIYEKAEYWVNKYDPVYVFNRNGKDLVKIYLMEPGELDAIIEKGF